MDAGSQTGQSQDDAPSTTAFTTNQTPELQIEQSQNDAPQTAESAANQTPEPLPEPELPFEGKIAIVTTAHGYRSAQEVQLKYGEDKVIRRTWPILYSQEGELMIRLLKQVAADPDVRALIIGQAVIGTNAAVSSFRELRGDDVFVVYVNPEEDLTEAAKLADLILTFDNEIVGQVVAEQAYAMGAETIVFYSSERHLAIPEIQMRRERMMDKAEELGLDFVDLAAPDQLDDGGRAAAQLYITQDVPRQVAELGVDTAFYSTIYATQAQLITQVIETGAIFPKPNSPSIEAGFEDALELGQGIWVFEGADREEFDGGEDKLIWVTKLLSISDEYFINAIKTEVAIRGARGRLGTWAASTYTAWTHIGAGYAIEWISGNVPQERGEIDLEVLNRVSEEYISALWQSHPVVFHPFTSYGPWQHHVVSALGSVVL